MMRRCRQLFFYEVTVTRDSTEAIWSNLISSCVRFCVCWLWSVLGSSTRSPVGALATPQPLLRHFSATWQRQASSQGVNHHQELTGLLLITMWSELTGLVLITPLSAVCASQLRKESDPQA